MTEIGPLPVFRLAGLPRGWRLLLKVQAEIGLAHDPVVHPGDDQHGLEGLAQVPRPG